MVNTPLNWFTIFIDLALRCLFNSSDSNEFTGTDESYAEEEARYISFLAISVLFNDVPVLEIAKQFAIILMLGRGDRFEHPSVSLLNDLQKIFNVSLRF